jgi:CTP:molybdopterin cytidylyltransferase MocA
LGVNEKTVLALDAHGGDQGLAVSVPAALVAVAEDPRLEIVLVGDRPQIEAVLESALASASGECRSRLRILQPGVPSGRRAAIAPPGPRQRPVEGTGGGGTRSGRHRQRRQYRR